VKRRVSANDLLINKIINTGDAMSNAVKDQFLSVFGAMPSNRLDQPTLDLCLVVAKSLAAALLHHKRSNPDSANIEQAEDAACTIVLNLFAEIDKKRDGELA